MLQVQAGFSTPIVRLISILFLASMSFSSCKNSGGSSANSGGELTGDDKGNTAQAAVAPIVKSLIIGPDGGEILADDGSWKLTVPKFALKSHQEIKISVNVLPTGTVGNEFKQLTKVYKFEPSGLFFDNPAKFWFKYNQGDMAENGLQEKMVGIYYINDDSTLEKTPSTVNVALNEATSELRHFSFGVGLTIQVFLVNVGVIANATPVLNIANSIIAHFASLADDMARQTEYLSQQALIDAFITKTEQILGYNPLFQAYPGIFPPGTTGGYNISYAGNGAISGSVPTDATRYAGGANVTISGNTGNLLRTNHTFVGWNTEPDGSGTTYVASANLTMPSAHVTLYALWLEDTKYSITYFGNGNNGGSEPIEAAQYYNGTTIIAAFNTGGLYKTMELFAGWNTAANGTGTSYAPGQALTMGPANLNLYATWQTRFTRLAGAAGKPTRGQGVVVDKDGNIFIAGYSDGNLNGATNNGNKDGFLIKYNKAGALQWTRLLGATAGKAANALGVVVDSNGNIYIAGATTSALDGNSVTGLQDAYIMKYDTHGTRLWTRLLGVAGSQTFPFGGAVLAIDTSGNLIFNGQTNGNLAGQTKNGIYDSFVAKYASDGTLDWVRLSGVAGAHTNSYGLITDTAGNIYSVGLTQGNLDGQIKSGTTDAFLIKYDSSGNKQWTRLTGAPSIATNIATVKTDRSGNVFIAGYVSAAIDGQALTGTTDAMFIKFDASGAKQWTRLFGVAGAVTAATALVIDPFDQVYLCGTTSGNLDGQIKTGTSDAFLAKHDTSGVRKYTRLLGISGAGTNPLACTNDENGNITVTGFTNGNLDGQILTGTEDFFVTNKIMDSSSNVAYPVTYNGNGHTSGTVPIDTGSYLHGAPVLVRGNTGNLRRTNFSYLGWNNQADGSGSVRTPGQQFSMGPMSEIIYADWRAKWTRLSGEAGKDSYGFASTMDAQDNSYTTGVAYGNLGGQVKTGLVDGFIEKIDKNGTKVWTRLLGQANTNTTLVGIAFHKPTSRLIVAGHRDERFNLNSWQRHAFILRYNTDGSPYSPHPVSAVGSTNGDTYATDVTVDAAGHQYIVGMTKENLDGEPRIANQDGYISKYNVLGYREWTRLVGSPGSSLNITGVLIGTNQLYVIGFVSGDLHGETNLGLHSAMVIAYDLNGNRLWTRLLGGTGANGRATTVAAAGASLNCNGVYITGYTYSNFGNAAVPLSYQINGFIFGYDESGAPKYPASTMPRIWFMQSRAYGRKIACDTDGKIHVAATTSGPVNGVAPPFANAVLLYAPLGSNSADRHQWYGGSGYYTHPAGMGFDSRGLRYLTGYTEGNLDGELKTGSSDVYVSTRLNK